jgi:hypothetical protein
LFCSVLFCSVLFCSFLFCSLLWSFMQIEKWVILIECLMILIDTVTNVNEHPEFASRKKTVILNNGLQFTGWFTDGITHAYTYFSRRFFFLFTLWIFDC